MSSRDANDKEIVYSLVLTLLAVIATALFFFCFVLPSIDTILNDVSLNSTITDDCVGGPPMPWRGFLILIAITGTILVVIKWYLSEPEKEDDPK